MEGSQVIKRTYFTRKELIKIASEKIQRETGYAVTTLDQAHFRFDERRNTSCLEVYFVANHPVKK